MSKNSIAEEARGAYINEKLIGYNSIKSSNEEELKPGEYLEKSSSKCDLIYRDKDSHDLMFIEIKSTASTSGKCFGAITASEIECAIQHPNNYFFVICVKNDNVWSFDIKYTIDELFNDKLMTIPPIKFYFNLSTTEKISKVNAKFKATTIVATKFIANKYLELRKQILGL